MPLPAAPGRILLVDDDPMIVRLVQKILAAKGIAEVVHAASGREALERLDGNGIAVVLLDHQLPDSTGLEVLDAIRARPHPPAVVMITAHGNESLAATALRRGADDYLAKDASLTEMLPQVLERVRRARELRKALAASERDLLRAERLAAIGEMTVTLHHEINNPLMSAFADVELLLADPAMPEAKRREGLQDIQTALRRIRDIVRQIGDLREVRTKSYVAGVRMVDLESPAASAPALSLGRAVVLLADEDLTRVVSLLLRHVGFEVQAAADVADLQARVEGVGVRLVVVSAGTDAAGAHPFGGFLPAEGRSYRLVALATGDGAPARGAGADLVVALPFDPGTFTADLVDLSTRGG
ncbi:MAG TPA: response regulator [Gemmatimonadales bacterium]|nr:response regulator [Gemmatimonadales bacterium]